MDPNALIAEFEARIQCKHCGKTNHYSDHCFEIQKKQKEDRLRTFLIQSGLSEEAAQKAVEDAKQKWKDQKQKRPQAGPERCIWPLRSKCWCWRPLSRDETDAGGH